MTRRRSAVVAVAALLASACPAALVHAQISGTDEANSDEADIPPPIVPPPIMRVAPPAPTPAVLPPPAPVMRVPPPAPAPPPRVGRVRDPEPLGNPGVWATPNDYPRDALRGDQEGTVRFRLTVDQYGAVADCIVTAGSGFASLDETTCRLMKERARFRPARDRAGKPTVGFYSNSVRWMIPQPPLLPQPRVPAPEAGGYEVSFIIERDGTISDCQTIGATGLFGEGADFSSLCPSNGEFLPYRDENGVAVRKRLTTTIRIDVTDVPDGAVAPPD